MSVLPVRGASKITLTCRELSEQGAGIAKKPVPAGTMVALGLVYGAAAGTAIGVAVAGGTGLALGAAMGAGLGIVIGATIDQWTSARSSKKPKS